MCSIHFAASDFDGGLDQLRPRLKVTAVPTIFPTYPRSLQPKIQKERPPPRSRTAAEQDQPELVPVWIDPIQDKKKSIASDHNYAANGKMLRKRVDLLVRQNILLKRSLDLTKSKLSKTRKALRQQKAALKKERDDSKEPRRLYNCLKNAASVIPFMIISRMISLVESGRTTSPFPLELQEFAVTLQHYSSRAYEFVRTTFLKSLPHLGTLSRWYSTINGDPGFTEESFSTLYEMTKTSSKEVLVNLVIDEMAIRKQLVWTGQQVEGYVSNPLSPPDAFDDSQKMAKEAIVLLAVGVNSRFKIVLGYWFIDGLNASDRAAMVTECLKKLHAVGVRATGVTCDSPLVNFSMFKILGAKLDPKNLRPYFDHPAVPGQRVFAIIDPVHGIKNIRNSLANTDIVNADGKVISWRYIERLQKVQAEEGLRLANKLKKRHVNFSSNRMKVALATQTLSRSVADAIDFLRCDLKHKDFVGSEATTEFIRIVDEVFDRLNSRNVRGRGTKAPLSQMNRPEWDSFFTKALAYIQGLKIDGVPVCEGRKKAGFLSFCMAMHTFRGLFEDLVVTGKMSFLLCYKWCQDHLELVFAMLRMSLGTNDNPSVVQYKAAYKRILTRNQLQACRSGNCLPQDGTTILANSAFKKGKPVVDLEDCGSFTSLPALLSTSKDPFGSSDVPLAPSSDLNIYTTNVVTYMASFVVLMCNRVLQCAKCSDLLASPEPQTGENHMLINQKRRGALVDASDEVVEICQQTELVIRRLLHKCNGELPKGPKVSLQIQIAVLENIKDKD